MEQSEDVTKNILHEIEIIVGRGDGLGAVYTKKLYDEFSRLQAALAQEHENFLAAHRDNLDGANLLGRARQFYNDLKKRWERLLAERDALKEELADIKKNNHRPHHSIDSDGDCDSCCICPKMAQELAEARADCARWDEQLVLACSTLRSYAGYEITPKPIQRQLKKAIDAIVIFREAKAAKLREGRD